MLASPGEFVCLIERLRCTWDLDCAMDIRFRDSVHNAPPTSKFHYSYLFLDTLVTSHVLSHSECPPWSSAIALIPLVRVQHRVRTALPYHWGYRTEECFTWHGVGAHNQSRNEQVVLIALLLATARCDVTGAHCNQDDLRTHYTRSRSKDKLRFGRVSAQISPQHPPIWRA